MDFLIKDFIKFEAENRCYNMFRVMFCFVKHKTRSFPIPKTGTKLSRKNWIKMFAK